MTKVGIVEDSKTTREGLATIIDLSPDFRCVCSCDTAEKALAQLPKHAPEVVLMDIQLPGMSGIECAGRL
jgi:DNA-binding NarL/FixJ family response regulator